MPPPNMHQEPRITPHYTILVADDEASNVRLITALLERLSYSVISTTFGASVVSLACTHNPDLILLDAMMPDLDGFAVATHLKANPSTQHIPIIMVTGMNDRSTRLKALEVGAEDFLTKPIDRAELTVRVQNLIRMSAYAKDLAAINRSLEEQIAERTQHLIDSYREAIHALHRASAYRDEETGAHIRRVSYYCVKVSKYLNLSEEMADHIFYASPMHDVGKIAIPDNVLFKPGPLSPDEWVCMKTHTTIGANMLRVQSTRSPYLEMGQLIAESHHERWDGSGYPNGIQGAQIPIAARIMQIADVYDALRSVRPYKAAFSHERAVEIILQGDGRTLPQHFDPEVLSSFRDCHLYFEKIYDFFKNEPHTDFSWSESPWET
jgi:putative two-component system response regulator